MINRKVNEQWSYQLGIRLENTIAKGWLEGAKAVNKNYVNVFPSAHIRYKTPTDKTFVLALSNRITRPSYWDVNPFRTYTTDESYFEGNPFLLPSTYYRQELSYTISGKSGTYTIQLAAGQSLDEIHALLYNPSNNFIANKKVNYADKYSYSSAVIYNNQLLPWWQVSGSVRVRKSTGLWNITLSAQDFFKSNKDRYIIQMNDFTILDELL